MPATQNRGLITHKFHSQARILICFYASYIFVNMVFRAEYLSMGGLQILKVIGSLAFYGFIVLYNYRQLKAEKVGQSFYSRLSVWQSAILILCFGLLLIEVNSNLLNVVAGGWYRIPTLLYASIILSIMIIGYREIRLVIIGLKHKSKN